MSKHNKWSRFEMNKNVSGLSPETSFQYSIPYQWGALHVTTQAEESYGFVPLTADVMKGNGIKTGDKTEVGIRTDIYLMSPEEFAEQAAAGALSPNSMMGGLGFGSTALHRNGLELRMALTQGTKDFRAVILDGISKFAEQVGSDIGDITTEDNIPLAEVISQDSPQVLVHGLCALTAEMTKESATEFLTIDVDKKALRKMTRLGTVGLVGAGAVLALNGLSHGEIDTFNVGTAIAYTGSYSFMAQHSMKRHLRQTSVRNRAIENAAARYADLVAGDIHKTYCTAHFDRQAEIMLNND